MKKYALLLTISLLVVPVAFAEQSTIEQQLKDKITDWAQEVKDKDGYDLKALFIDLLSIARLINETNKRSLQGDDSAELIQEAGNINARLEQKVIELQENFVQNEELQKRFANDINSLQSFVPQPPKESLETLEAEEKIQELEYVNEVIDYILEQLN